MMNIRNITYFVFFVFLCACGKSGDDSPTPSPTPCPAGQVRDTPEGACRAISAIKTCTQLGCVAAHRVCSDSDAVPACGTCFATYYEMAGTCTALKTCTNTPCASMETCSDIDTTKDRICTILVECKDLTCPHGCQEAGHGSPAQCHTPRCPNADSNGLYDSNGQCVSCQSCNNTGENGPYLVALDEGDNCICTTTTGYYWNDATLSTQPCDADNDGWTRIEAKAAVESLDPVIDTNARCAVREITQVTLTAESGEKFNTPIDPATPLYESTYNDSGVTPGTPHPAYSTDRPLAANELNTLTKYCVNKSADFNDNEVADINEWHNMPTASMPSYYPLLVNYSYFAELHQGYFDPLDGLSPRSGGYVIKEKSRTASFPLTYQLDDPTNNYWQTCHRDIDSDFATLQKRNFALQGLDFAWATPTTSWPGMTHHSQFKCLQITPSPDPAQANQENKNTADLNFQRNACVAIGTTTATGIPNPSVPVITCNASTDQSTDTVTWAVAKYRDYQISKNNYKNGCVNECLSYASRCEGWTTDEELSRAECQPNRSNFGKEQCFCGTRYGADCDFGCPGESDAHVSTSPGFRFFPEPREGTWLCGILGGGDPLTLITGSDPSTGYRVEGSIPAAITPTTVSCTGADCSTGFSVR